MPTLLDRAPFPDVRTEVFVRNEFVRLRPNQIILRVSLTIPRVKSPNPLAVPFPVILDTGYTHTFALQEQHLFDWGGLRPDALPAVGTTSDRGTRVPLRAANIWVHPNRPRAREVNTERAPYPLKTEFGIAVYPAGDFPRLPLLGLRAVAENDLVLKVNGRRREATLRAPRGWWPF